MITLKFCFLTAKINYESFKQYVFIHNEAFFFFFLANINAIKIPFSFYLFNFP